MNKKNITLTISPLLASCLQRMLVDEINNQKQWARDEEKDNIFQMLPTRKKIIDECEKAREELKQQGINKHFYY